MNRSKRHDNTVSPSAASRQSISDKPWLWIAIVAAIATLVRVIYWLESGDDPLRGQLLLDAKVYDLMATEIARETFWGSEVFFRAPLFQYILAFTYQLFGIQQTAITFLNLLMGVAAAVLTYLTARNYLRENWARDCWYCRRPLSDLVLFRARNHADRDGSVHLRVDSVCVFAL